MLQKLLLSAAAARQLRCAPPSCSYSTGFGPYRHWRQGQHFVGVQPPLLKYHQVPLKLPHEPYGCQDDREKQPGKGMCYTKRPVRMQLKKDHVYAWCACGYSGHQPLCDGTHNRQKLRTGNLSCVRYIPDRDMDVWLCACKQTKNRPFCDGSHKTAKLPNEYTDEDLKDLQSNGQKL